MGRRLPGLLLAPAGFAAIVVVAGVFTSRGETASLATPAVVVLALAGAALSYPMEGAAAGPLGAGCGARRLRRLRGAGRALRAPDLCRLHQTRRHRHLAGLRRPRDEPRARPLRPRTLQLPPTLEVNLPAGYPVGAFLPLGVGTQLTAERRAWLVQPYMATMAGLMALCLAWLARPLVESGPCARWSPSAPPSRRCSSATASGEGSRRLR